MNCVQSWIICLEKIVNKVKLTIIKDSPYAVEIGHTSIVQEVDFDAEKCAERLSTDQDMKGFLFGSAFIYTHEVQAFIFEDVKE